MANSTKNTSIAYLASQRLFTAEDAGDFNSKELYLNNSARIKFSNEVTNLVTKIQSAAIELRSNSNVGVNGLGVWKPITVSNNPNDGSDALYYDNNLVITENNILNELEIVLLDNPIEFSNIALRGGYINFIDWVSNNTNLGPTGVGLRFNDTLQRVEFRNGGTGEIWRPLLSANGYTHFAMLEDVNVSGVVDKDYIRYDSGTSKYISAELDISHDTTPVLGGNLSVSTYGINDASDKPLIRFASIAGAETNPNYLVIRNNYNDGVVKLETSGPSGVSDVVDIQIMAGNGSGNIYVDSLELNVDGRLCVNGYSVGSIWRASQNGFWTTGVSTSNTLTISMETALFDVSGYGANTYEAIIPNGFKDGHKLNLIYHNTGSNSITVKANFGVNGLGSGFGLASNLILNTSGQGASLIYLDTEGIWQLLHTGAGLE